MRRLAIAALLLLGACGGKEKAQDRVIAKVGDTEIRADGMKMGDIELSTNANSVQCTQRPDYVPLYPDARIQACTSLGKGGQIIFTTDAAANDVKSFYRKAAQAAKLEKDVSEQGNMFSANDGKSRRMTVMVSPDEHPPMVQIIYGDITG